MPAYWGDKPQLRSYSIPYPATTNAPSYQVDQMQVQMDYSETFFVPPIPTAPTYNYLDDYFLLWLHALWFSKFGGQPPSTFGPTLIQNLTIIPFF